MILAGVDEAGLGPSVGPLATAAAALEVPDDWRPESPWERLSETLAEKGSRNDSRLIVTDSKTLYRVGGLAGLELTVGVFSWLANGCFRPVLMEANEEGGGSHACYTRRLEPFPLLVTAAAVSTAAGKVAESLEQAKAKAAHLEASSLYEPVLNQRFVAGLNKHQALLIETGRHLRRLVEKFSDQPLLIMVDKQGGRNDYLPFLSGLFPGLWTDVVETGATQSRYRLRRPGGDAEIRFLAKADKVSFPTALASLAAKYVRERAMRELNAWFEKRLPGLKPTAGYPEDARRWLAEVRNGGEDVELVVRLR
ncbi:MAG: hypothetical protein FWG74_05585 [Planctomycetes bacterium]|nr:hypothetical protein [Planctomycetota bacterium]